MGPEERKMYTFLQQAKTLRNQRKRAKKENDERRRAERQKMIDKDNAKRLANLKESRKRQYRAESLRKAKRAKF